jgi:hypothetical protein
MSYHQIVNLLKLTIEGSLEFVCVVSYRGKGGDSAHVDVGCQHRI